MTIGKRAEISVALGLILALILSVVSFGAECSSVRKDVIRLHILANSDNDEDQLVKLAVRDALLASGKELFSGTVTKSEASTVLEREKESLRNIADKVLRENGFDYTSYIYLAEEYFSTREYENFTLPAGRYLALKVILGKGEGHNWWCVMYPPLCLSAAMREADLDAIIGENGAELIKQNPKFEIRFKIVEVIERLKNKRERETQNK